MLISEQTNAALNEQVGHEFAASLQYVSIAAHSPSSSLSTSSMPAVARRFLPSNSHRLALVRHRKRFKKRSMAK
jgi:ferritin